MKSHTSEDTTYSFLHAGSSGGGRWQDPAGGCSGRWFSGGVVMESQVRHKDEHGGWGVNSLPPFITFQCYSWKEEEEDLIWQHV